MFKRILIILISGIFIFGVSKLSFAMMCAQAESSEHKHMESEATLATAKEAVDVGNKICPVSGEKINEKLKATYEYKGKIYNFCCKACVKDFKKDPQKYIEKLEAVEEKETAEHQGHAGHHHEGAEGHQHQ